MLPEITITGRAVADPELRFSASGQAVANFRVACSESKKLDDGTWEDGDRLFVNVAIWKDAAETVAEKITKGTKVTVTGRLYQREYETSSGEKRTSLEMKFATAALPLEGRMQQTAPVPAADPWTQTTSSGAWGAELTGQEPPF